MGSDPLAPPDERQQTSPPDNPQVVSSIELPLFLVAAIDSGLGRAKTQAQVFNRPSGAGFRAVRGEFALAYVLAQLFALHK